MKISHWPIDPTKNYITLEEAEVTRIDTILAKDKKLRVFKHSIFDDNENMLYSFFYNKKEITDCDELKKLLEELEENYNIKK